MPGSADGFPLVDAVRSDPAGPAGRAADGRPKPANTSVPNAERIAQLRSLKRQVLVGHDAATERQHAKGKLTARERIAELLDPGTFTEIEALRRHRARGFGMEDNRPHTDGVITGWGKIHDRTVFVYAHDFRIYGGALGEAHAQKIHKAMDLAIATGAPLISLNDGAGARIQEGVTALAGYGGIFTRNSHASGVIPQISVMLGPCAGGAAYSPALTDFVFMVRDTAQMFITGPEVVAAVTGQAVSQDALGGADAHGGASGVAHFVLDDERECLREVRYLISLLPQNNRELPEQVQCTDPVDRRCDALDSIVPHEGNQPYDMRRVVEQIVDDGEYFEVHQRWAQNVLVMFARLGGDVVGIVANQPMSLAGVLDINASDKAARFVQTCNAFNIPIITLLDVPGFLPGVDQEHGGIIRHGAKLLYAYCTATVPRISLVLRKAYGGAYIVMDSRSVGADIALAWPGNEIAVMGAEGAANVIFRKEIDGASDSYGVRQALIQQYRDELIHPFYAAERGLVDDIIEPSETRAVLIRSLEMLRTKHADMPLRKHGNPPT
ncbi:MAG: acyl-CoA carboxylase subunit beta [Dermatophilaceae bacterium]